MVRVRIDAELKGRLAARADRARRESDPPRAGRHSTAAVIGAGSAVQLGRAAMSDDGGRTLCVTLLQRVAVQADVPCGCPPHGVV